MINENIVNRANIILSMRHYPVSLSFHTVSGRKYLSFRKRGLDDYFLILEKDKEIFYKKTDLKLYKIEKTYENQETFNKDMKKEYPEYYI